MEDDAAVMRQGGPTLFIQAKHRTGVNEVAEHIFAAYQQQVPC